MTLTDCPMPLASPSPPPSQLPTPTFLQNMTAASNIRPLIVCGVIALVLIALQHYARVTQARDAEQTRRQLYCKHGSFSSPITMMDVPQDVRCGVHGAYPRCTHAHASSNAHMQEHRATHGLLRTRRQHSPACRTPMRTG